MILVVLAIAASTAVGVAADRRFGAGAERFAQRLMDLLLWVLMPPVVLLVVSDVELGGGVGAGLLLGYLELGIVGLAAWAIGHHLLRLSRAGTGTLIVTVILANTGYLGIPLSAALLGSGHLGEAVTWDVVVSGLMLFGPAFAVGAAFGTTAGDDWRQRARAFVTRNPVLPAVVAGLLVPDMPDVLVDAAEIVALSLLPIGFFVLGVHLTHEAEDGALRIPPPLNAAVGVAIGLRLVVAPALLLGLSALLVDVPDAYLMQAAMPSGINALVVSHVYGLDLRLAASAVAWTTAIVVLGSLVAAPFV